MTLLLSLSTEICVILFFVAAAVIALSVRPKAIGPARQLFLRGSLSKEGPEEPSIDIHCLDDGSIVIWRNGLTGMTDTDELNLAILIRGFDVEITEREAPSNTSSTAAVAIDSARFHLEGLGEEHYHITYKIGPSVAAAFTLHNRPGLRRHLPLSI